MTLQSSDGAKGAFLPYRGIIHPRRVKEFYDVNVECTRNLLEASTAVGLQRAVIMSSNSPCGCNRIATICSTIALQPYMNYGRSKMEMEKVVHGFQESAKIETAIIRAPWFYGPHQPPRQKLFFDMIRDGKGPIVGDGNTCPWLCENLPKV